MLRLKLTSTAITGLLLAASFVVAAQSNSLDSLPLATQDEITQVCLPVQFSDGAAAYRDCVKSELASRSNGSTTVFEQLSFDDKYAVQQACADTGEQSSQNYQACVAAQISQLNLIANPSLDGLSEDELYVVQQSCFNAQSTQGAARYRQCLTDELQSLRGIPAADTSTLSMLNKNALQLRCSSNVSNVVQYRQCIADQYESVAGTAPSFLPATEADIPEVEIAEAVIPEVEIVGQTAATSGESVTAEPAGNITELQSNQTSNQTQAEAQAEARAEAQNVEQTASTDSVATSAALNSEPTIAEYTVVSPDTETALLENSDGFGQPTTVIQSDADTTFTNNSNDSTSARVISRPDLVESLEAQGQTNAQTGETIPGTGADSSNTQSQNVPLMQKLNELWQTLLDSLSSMNSTGWLLIAGVLALPALLLGIFAMIRGLRSPSPAAPEYVAPNNYNQFESGLDSRRLRHEEEAATLFDDDMFSDHDDVTRIASKSDRQRASQRQTAATNGASPKGAYSSGDYQPSAAKTRSNKNGWQSAFGDWLLQQPEAKRLEVCIEFLIYWVAYGDDRYPPELKHRLFTNTELSSHDQIKRWVLKQDEQLDQCIALLMALLVTEHSITPVQNTLLRFLSDAFNIGKQQLELRFEKAFGHPMPPVPRTDKYAWWAKQQPEFMQRWEARFMATRAENEQMIARLGLTADYVEAQVINAFRRAARRCHPDRFTELGDRERALAEQQFVKFEQARDKLLGVSV